MRHSDFRNGVVAASRTIRQAAIAPLAFVLALAGIMLVWPATPSVAADLTEAELPPGHITQAENKARMSRLADLRKLADMAPAAVAELIPGGRRAHAKAWIKASADVLGRFPSG